MKWTILKIIIAFFTLGMLASSCSRYSSLNRKSNIGAERLMSGEKAPKMKRFKS